MRLVTTILVLILSVPMAFAAGGGGYTRHADVDLGDKASLKNGAKLFMNYCQGCHSLEYMRYNRMAEDLGIPLEVLRSNLMFNSDKDGAPIMSSLREDEALAWFGKVPPDLSLFARARGADYVFTYLTSFYKEEGGKVNNVALPNASMPHVLWEQQGWQSMTKDENGEPVLTIAEPGNLTPEEFDSEMNDLVSFMVYVAEPAALVRTKVGVYVILYLALMLIVFYCLKKEFWRDVH